MMESIYFVVTCPRFQGKTKFTNDTKYEDIDDINTLYFNFCKYFKKNIYVFAFSKS